MSDIEDLLRAYVDLDNDPRNVFLVKPPDEEEPRSRVARVIDKMKRIFKEKNDESPR